MAEVVATRAAQERTWTVDQRVNVVIKVTTSAAGLAGIVEAAIDPLQMSTTGRILGGVVAGLCLLGNHLANRSPQPHTT